MLALLDNYWDTLCRAGYPGKISRPGPDEQVVTERLLAAGYGALPELVAFFSWADYPEAGKRELELFAWHFEPLPLDQAIEAGKEFKKFLASWPNPEEAEIMSQPGEYPGPADWIPIAMHVDTRRVLSVDTNNDTETSGSVWALDNETGGERLFDSLEKAIGTAISYLDSGAWVIRPGPEHGRCIESTDRNIKRL